MNTESTNQQDEIDSLEPNYVPLSIDDFSEFIIQDDSEFIDSSNDDTEISFGFSGGTASGAYEYYVLSFDSYGNCSFFDIKLKLHYITYPDFSPMISTYLMVGSYYDYLGNYIDGNFTGASHALGYGGIQDGWLGDAGLYTSAAYVNDVVSKDVTEHILPFNGAITIQLTRNTTGFYSLVYDTILGHLILGQSWATGIDKPLNYIKIFFGSGTSTSVGYVTAYDFSADLVFEDYPDSIDPYVNIINPANNSYIPIDSVTIDWEGYDLESGLSKYYTKLDDNSYLDVGLSTTHTYYDLSYGNHEVEIMAVDNESNTFSDFVSFFINITQEEPEPDIIAPELSIIYPINQSTILTSSITVTWTGNDNDSGIGNYYIRINNNEWIDVNLSTFYTFDNLIDGPHTIEVKAVDNEFNDKICLISFTILTTTPTAESSGYSILLAIFVLFSVIAFVKISLRFKTEK